MKHAFLFDPQFLAERMPCEDRPQLQLMLDPPVFWFQKTPTSELEAIPEEDESVIVISMC